MLFELEVGGFDDFRPLLDFALQPVAELLGCHGVDLGALLGEVVLHLRRVEYSRDLGIEPTDGFFRRSRRRDHARGVCASHRRRDRALEQRDP